MKRRLQKAAIAVAAVLGVSLVTAHGALRRACRIDPPRSAAHAEQPSFPRPHVRTLAESFVLERPHLLEVHLSGAPDAIGWAHARLLYPEMVENEGILLNNFQKAVPTGILRGILLDLAQLRYRNIAARMSPERRAEIAAGALGFQPDPYANLFPTFQRFVYLNALYDIALSFEHSPLIGCTTFVVSGNEAAGGGAFLARNFDFEVDPIFDRKKAVFFVRETDKIPFASVAWPGLVGVVSGMNREGVALVVHGARAGNPQAEGEPVVHALRAVLSNAHDTDEAIAVLAARPPLVSHIVIVTDAGGHSVKIERVPQTPDHVIELGTAAAVTNHFDGPAANDPKNLAVRAHTSTLPRKARADELVQTLPRPIDARALVSALRDRRGANGEELALGDRNAIDALIATHGVVMDTRRRWLWVSTSPHVLGRFLAFDLARMLAPGYGPEPELALPEIPADPLLDSERFRSAGAPH